MEHWVNHWISLDLILDTKYKLGLILCMVVEYNGGYEKRFDVTVSNHMTSNNFPTCLDLLEGNTRQTGGNRIVLTG